MYSFLFQKFITNFTNFYEELDALKAREKHKISLITLFMDESFFDKA